MILPVLYGCETWSLTLREEHILRVFENKALFSGIDHNLLCEWRAMDPAAMTILSKGLNYAQTMNLKSNLKKSSVE
jgi:hypothetical protein